MASASSPNSGNAYSGPVCDRRVGEHRRAELGRDVHPGELDVVAAGGAEPHDVPRVVDRERLAPAASTSRTSGIPLGSIRTVPPSSTTQPPISQSACRQPLANGQRPLTR